LIDVQEEEIIVTNQEPKIVVKGLWGWAAKRLGIQPWGQVLIILLLGQAWIIWGIRTDVSEIKGTIRAMPLTCVVSRSGHG